MYVKNPAIYPFVSTPDSCTLWWQWKKGDRGKGRAHQKLRLVHREPRHAYGMCHTKCLSSISPSVIIDGLLLELAYLGKYFSGIYGTVIIVLYIQWEISMYTWADEMLTAAVFIPRASLCWKTLAVAYWSVSIGPTVCGCVSVEMIQLSATAANAPAFWVKVDIIDSLCAFSRNQ